MTQITFTINDESKLSLILNWLKNQDAVRNVSTQPISLTAKQLEMKNDLQKSLEWVKKVEHGEIEVGKDASILLAELERMSSIPLTAKQLEMKEDLEAALLEVELHRQGKIKLKTWAELRNELQTD